MTDFVQRTPLVNRGIRWGAVFAGAICAAALASILHAFAAAVGLAVSSAAPTWRDASTGLFILSGVYLILVALASYGLGGYVAGLLRDPMDDPVGTGEVEFRDNMHGLLVWGAATLITAFFLLATLNAGTRLAAPSGGAPGAATSVAGENTVAFDVDRVLRGDRRPADVDVMATRAEVARILMTSSSHSGVASEDRNYLVRLIGMRTGATPPEAERRADAAIASAKENLARARRSGVILAFMAGAAALLGAVAAWFAAAAGGRHRDITPKTEGWHVFGRRHF